MSVKQLITKILPGIFPELIAKLIQTKLLKIRFLKYFQNDIQSNNYVLLM